ncbi:MAG: DUF2182 domain-containing protein [bacterium]
MSEVVGVVVSGGRAHARRRVRPGTASQHAFLGAVAVIACVSAAVTMALCASMESMGEVPMSGGWAMSMTWFRMPGHTWAGAATSFVAMWVAMMMAMMLPSLVPVLLRIRRDTGNAGARRIELLTVVVSLGYFAMWAMVGLLVFPLGAMLGNEALRLPTLARTVPLVGSACVILAGALQFSAWRSRHLGSLHSCSPHGAALPGGLRAAWRLGVRLGVHCLSCCAGSTAVLLVLGVSDVRAMSVISVSIVAERFSRDDRRVSRTLGALAVAYGAVMLARAVNLLPSAG